MGSKWLYRRQYSVQHGRDGFSLSIDDRWIPYLIADAANDLLMAALGHPCCGKGLGRIPFTDLLWFRTLNLSSRLVRHRDRHLLRLPLTVEQAFLLRPKWREDPFFQAVTTDGTDEDGYTWLNGVMIGTPSN